MKLVNLTKDKILADRIIFRKTPFEIMTGLIPFKMKNRYFYDIFKFKKFSKNDAMVFEVYFPGGVHTWFMSFPITVVFVDINFTVVKKIKMKPFEVFSPEDNYRYFIELVGSKYSEIDIGDELSISKK